MASRNFNRLQALEKEIKHLNVEISIGATGAPTLVKKLGVASISRTSAGLYVLTLQDKYSRFINMQIMQEAAAAEDLDFQVVSKSVNSAKTITFLCKTGGVATDPSNGSRLYLDISLKNSSVGE